VCDVADFEALESVANAVGAVHGPVHVLINNAGITVAAPVEDLSFEHFQRVMAVNFWGVVHGCRAFLPHLRAAAERGETAAVCNVLSEFALMSLPTKAAYAASKHAARAFTEALGAELYGTGIVVTAAYPGATATELVRRGYAVDQVKREREAEFLTRGMHPDVVARKILRGIERGRARVLVGKDARLIDVATRLAPSVVRGVVRRFWRRVPFL
jgi:short-subunit dehydrogenase